MTMVSSRFPIGIHMGMPGKTGQKNEAITVRTAPTPAVTDGIHGRREAVASKTTAA